MQIGGVSHDTGDWNVFYLFLHNERFEENCRRCPRTVELLERCAPRQYKHAFFSALNPGTHVIPHTGVRTRPSSFSFRSNCAARPRRPL